LGKVNNLKRYKQQRAFEKVVSDIPEILNVLSLTQRALSVFKSYIAAQELISVIECNKVLLEAQLNKYSQELEKMKGEV
jgi:hypothetical protein